MRIQVPQSYGSSRLRELQRPAHIGSCHAQRAVAHVTENSVEAAKQRMTWQCVRQELARCKAASIGLQRANAAVAEGLGNGAFLRAEYSACQHAPEYSSVHARAAAAAGAH